MHEPDIFQRPIGKPGPADDIAQGNRPKGPRIVAGVAVVAQDEDMQRRHDARGVVTQLRLLQIRFQERFAVHIHLTVVDFHLLAGERNDALDQKIRTMLRQAQNHDVATAGPVEAIG